MTCSEFLRRYSDYDDSLLSPEENAACRAHMAVCASCARYDRVLRKGRMIARQLPHPEPSRDFFPCLHARLDEVRRQRRQARVGATGTLAAATVVLAAVGGLGLLRGAELSDAATDGGFGGRAVGAPVRGGGAGEPLPTLVGRSDAAWAANVGESAPFLRLAQESTPRPRDWMTVRVDRPVRASYSPLVTGPPLYRAPPAGYTAGAAASTARAID